MAGILSSIQDTMKATNEVIDGVGHNASTAIMNMSNEFLESLRTVTRRIEHTTWLMTNAIHAIAVAIVFSLLFLLTGSFPFLRHLVEIMFVVLCVCLLLTYMKNSQSVLLPNALQRRAESELDEIITTSKEHDEIDLTGRMVFDDHIATSILPAISAKQCMKLRLGHNMITSSGGSALANALLHNYTLEQLSLWNNRLLDIGAEFLAKSLAINRNALRKLDLSANGITDVGASKLAQMLKTNKTLTHLSLCRNEISDQGVQQIVKVLQKRNKTLQALSLSDNEHITDACADNLLEMIKENRSLAQLWMDGCRISRASQSSLQMAARSAGTLRIYL